MRRKRRAQALPLSDDEGPSCSGEGDGPAAAKRPCTAGKAKAKPGKEALSKSTAGLVSSFFLPAGGGSGKTLADLQLAPGEEETLRDLLSQLPPKHAAERAAIRARHQAQMGRWWAQWRAGNSLLFYGFGSKYELLQTLAREKTRDGACFTANGLDRSLTARQVLQWAVAALKQAKPQVYRSYSKEELLELIASEAGRRRVYIILHNIDGPGLRDPASQRLLSQLAAQPHVHLAASVDHINFPLLWDLQTRDCFAWTWHNVTNYEPYSREVAYAAVPALLGAGGRGESSKQSAGVVLASLSHNAREVFRLIADQQLDPGTADPGIPFQQLFQRCRERFLVSNEMLLKSFLQEFRDHELLTTKRASDGAELLHIPMEQAVLQQVLDDLDALG